MDYKNNKNHLNHKFSVPVIIDYYYKGKRTKVSTGVVCQIKDWDDNWRKKTSEEFVVNLSEHLRECKRVLNDRGSFFLNLGDTFYNGNLQNVPHRVIIKLQEQGWILDPFMGSGTTGRVCDKLGRSFVGYDFKGH